MAERAALIIPPMAVFPTLTVESIQPIELAQPIGNGGQSGDIAPNFDRVRMDQVGGNRSLIRR